MEITIQWNNTPGTFHTETAYFVNPNESAWYPNPYHREAGLYLLQFGAYDTTFVYVFAHDFGSALEEAAGYVADKGWRGYFSEPDYADAARELGAPEGWEEDPEWADRVKEEAETDHTYTESGWILSWGWHGTGPLPADEVEKVLQAARAAGWTPDNEG